VKKIIKLSLIRIDKRGCHLITKGKIGRRNIRLVIDTGASQTVFDKNRIGQYIGHEDFEKVDTLSSGLGTNTMESHLVKIHGLRIGTVEIKNEKVVLLDLSHVNQSYEMMNMKPIDGVIGGDILKHHKAVIDYGKKTLTLVV
jgi:predicted aspartyl protease